MDEGLAINKGYRNVYAQGLENELEKVMSEEDRELFEQALDEREAAKAEEDSESDSDSPSKKKSNKNKYEDERRDKDRRKDLQKESRDQRNL